MKKRKINWKVLIISLVVVYSVAFVGSIFTSQGTNTEWYESIKPSITPPNWVFPVVWNILFLLIALSLYFSWIKAKEKNVKIKLAIVFGINFLLNILWSLFFFTLKKPLYAYFDLVFLWGSIAIMIFLTIRIDKKASLFLLPYLFWVSFAGVLNYLSVFG